MFTLPHAHTGTFRARTRAFPMKESAEEQHVGSWGRASLCAMGVMEVTREMLAAKFGSVFPHLDERQRRLLMGAEARALGHGGIQLVARAAGVREATVSLGV